MIEAIERAERGLVDADLSGGIIRQRVARKGQGRRAGYRTLIAFLSGDCAVFLYGFAKSERANITPDIITPDMLASLRLLGGLWLTDRLRIEKDVKVGILIEVSHDDES